MRGRKKNKLQPWQFRCNTCGETSTAPANGTLLNRVWRRAWVEEDLIACLDCLDVFHHETVTILSVSTDKWKEVLILSQ